MNISEMSELRDKIYKIGFRMNDGYTTCEPDLLDLAINRYGEDVVYAECLKAADWLTSHAARHKRRSVKGINIFMLNWFEGAAYIKKRDAENRTPLDEWKGKV